MTKNRNEEAYRVFKRIAKSNKKNFYYSSEDDDMVSIQESDITTEEKHVYFIKLLINLILINFKVHYETDSKNNF